MRFPTLAAIAILAHPIVAFPIEITGSELNTVTERVGQEVEDAVNHPYVACAGRRRCSNIAKSLSSQAQISQSSVADQWQEELENGVTLDEEQPQQDLEETQERPSRSSLDDEDEAAAAAQAEAYYNSVKAYWSDTFTDVQSVITQLQGSGDAGQRGAANVLINKAKNIITYAASQTLPDGERLEWTPSNDYITDFPRLIEDLTKFDGDQVRVLGFRLGDLEQFAAQYKRPFNLVQP